jgi:dynein heavy chain
MSAAPIPKDQEGPKFPISLLQRSIKMAAEPPTGIKANVVRMYDNMRRDNLQDVENKMQLRKAIYGLVWFHSVVIERKKFKTLGWNVSYTFNDSDYSVCEDILKIYMGQLKDGIKDPKFDSSAAIPWDAVRVLIGECNYGGRVTDPNDRLLMNTYTKEIFNDELVAIDKWKPVGTEQQNYGYLVDEGANQKNDMSLLWTPETFKTEIQLQMEEGGDPPSAFGQHPNAEIQSQINDTNELLESIVALQPL